ncbi:sugar ABC transporter permease [Mycoplasmatota bacterium]|nr:sugar ABC transporter permease [Mycoplasmatota bacterium]
MGSVKKLLSFKEILLRFLIYLELTTISLIILIPVIWVIGASFSPKGGIGWHIWPDKLSLHQYQELLVNKVKGTERPKYEFVNWYKNTLLVAIVTCIFSVIFVTMVAYVFARFKFKGKKFGLLGILILQMFPSFMGLIALYNLFVTFGFNDKPMALTFVYVSGAIPYNVWLVKGYLQNIPKSLDESAMIDGASKIKIFTKIIFPLSSPIITFLAISMFMSPWMDFMLPRMVISSNNKQTLAIGLYNLINNKAQQFTLFAAGALMVALPITILYSLLQRYLIEGITAGANKG